MPAVMRAGAACILVPALLVGSHALRTSSREQIDEITGEPAAAVAWRPSLAAVLQERQQGVITPAGPISSWGKTVDSEAQAASGPGGKLAAELGTPGLTEVCERARGAVFAEHSDLGGSVYRECASDVALRGIREGNDAVSVLNDCMVLVDELVRRLKDHRSSAINAPEGALCRNVVDGMKAGWIVAKPMVPQGETMQLVAASQPDALQKAAEAMADICVDAVQDAEVGVKNEEDAMRLHNAVAPLCEETAHKRLNDPKLDFAAINGTLREWCFQLDGRLSLALETGFLFALHPEDAYQQAGSTNPYATATRRQFCDRFGASVKKQAIAQRAAAKAAPKTAPMKAPAAVAATPPATPTDHVLAAQPPSSVAAPEPAKAAASSPAVATQPAPARQGGIDMLRLLKALSAKSEWASTCGALVTSLASKEGSVIDDQVLLDTASRTEVGEDVLTFNAPDQAEVGRCANRLKVLAVQSGELGGVPAAPRHDSALLEVSEASEGASELQTADQLGALIDSPWARDACTDIAHGYLMARLAARRLSRPAEQAPQFCKMYAQDLQSLQDNAAVQKRLRVQQEVDQLRKGRLSASMRQHKAAMSQAMPSSAKEQKPANQKMALAAEGSQSVVAQEAAPKDTATQDDSDDGSGFWGS